MAREGLVGVAGAGVMGSAIAAELARTGFDVVLYDTDAEARALAPAAVRRALRQRTLLRGEAPGEPLETTCARVAVTGSLAALGPCAVLIENIVEEMSEKERFYRQLQALPAQAELVVVNSSTAEIARVSTWIGRTGDVVGVHFMNPVCAIDAAEVITNDETTPAARAAVEALLARLGKQSLHVRDSCGYVSNRIYMLTVNEAIHTLAGGVAPAETIDQIFQRCFGWKTGPLATADLIGLDTVRLSLEALRQGFADEKFAPAPLLDELVRTGRLGCKSGGGFYDYA